MCQFFSKLQIFKIAVCIAQMHLFKKLVHYVVVFIYKKIRRFIFPCFVFLLDHIYGE